MNPTGAIAVLVLLVTAVAGCTEEPGTGTPTPTGPQCNAIKRTGLTLRNGANPVAVWNTSKGCFAAELFVDKTPITSGNFFNLTKSGFYNGTRFHRVIGPSQSPPDGFMIQDGDPLSKDTSKASSWGTGGPGYSIPDEFPCNDGFVSKSNPANCGSHGGLMFKHTSPGILSMANSGPNSGGSQYFVTLAPTSWLDGKHAIFGQVVSGMEAVRAIGNVPTTSSDRPVTDVVIASLTLI